MITNCLAACTHLSSTVSQLFEPQVQKIAVFTYRSHIFVTPGDAPATITQYVAWMERQFNACQTPRSMYLSIFNSFRVIRWLSKCVSPKITIYYILVCPGRGTPSRGSMLNVVSMKSELGTECLRLCIHIAC